MASQLKTLYEDLGRAFFSKPSDLKKCVAVLSKLKVCSSLLLPIFAHSLKIGLIEAGLLLPQGDVNLGDLVVARSHPTELNYCSLLILRISGDILEIGAFCSIRSRDVPSFDRYFSQLQTFYTDYRSVIYNRSVISIP